ncbi:MAG: hypothetical protein RJB39_798 [Candidatus Parcubacteria bacterium]|jgi:hypothetical protein
MSNFNSYLSSLKSALDNTTEQAVANTPAVDSVTTPVISPRLFTGKFILWGIGICIIGVSVTAFVTQLVLLGADNIREGKTALTPSTDTEDKKDSLENMYVRADAKNIFGTELSPTESTLDTVDLGIPGVSKIGFDTKTPNKVLTDNINKYSQTTFVIGGRQGEAGGESLIGGGDDLSLQGRYSLLSTPVAPILSSKAYLVADVETGEVILEKNADTAYPLASVSKLMTAVVARENMDLQSIAIVSRDASNAYGAQGSLGLGEKIRISDLFPPLLMESSNDAAEVFADQYGHAKFMEAMNKKAVELNMMDTYYGDPSGLDPQNVSTPQDLLKLARFIAKNDPQIYDFTRVKQFSIKGHTWYNRNALLLTPGFTGGKNGYIDQSRQTTVSLFDVTMARGGVRPVVIIILKSENKNGDVAKLLNYLKRAALYEAK